MSDTTPTTSPTAARDGADPGDQMQRNVRYQHAYGVVVLTAALRGELPYISIWCEQHEDVLAERPDALYDALQIKTKKPEDGAWVWADDGLRDSVKRFVRLDKKFPGRISGFSFVSNVACHESKAEGQIKRSPPLLVRAIVAGAPLDGELKSAMETLYKHCDCAEADLAAVLKRLSFQQGPPREHMLEVVAHRHVARCVQCQHMNSVLLDACVDVLAQIVARASSLDVRDGKNDFWALAGSDRQDPFLAAKRIHVSVVREVLDELHSAPFRYSSMKAMPKIGTGTDYLSVMNQKLVRGGLAEYVELMTHRTESAERHLLELQSLDPASFDTKFNQLVSVVKAQCDEARLDTATDGALYGKPMLREVHRRLRELAQTRPAMVHGAEYDLLAGIAGLLTGDCKVWWGEQFNVEVAA
ncbi:MAG: hypothetical protein QOF78_2890 [Phycisphaerales bacterium]|jgi:hypothetical protein|nr:hypothetical protein [Phycisphaerales bacterium]